MSNLNREIKTDDLGIEELVKLLCEDKFLIPTFQREFVWEPSNIIKLWDSIYRFYPIGSLLFWKTDSYLQTHRKLGGFAFPHDEDEVRKFKEWKYILDGQQRATSLLVSILGGKGRVEDHEEFDYTLYFDPTRPTEDENKFFFTGELEKRKRKVNQNFLIRIKDVPKWDFTFYKDISSHEGFDETIQANLQNLDRMFKDYKIPVIHIRGVEVQEVCEIFERINQEGKKLGQVDIIVARTYRNEDKEKGYSGFYLRDKLDALNEVLVEQGSRFQHMEELTILQMFALCLRKEETEARKSHGITPTALDNFETKHFEQGWDEGHKTILNTVKALSDLKIQGPEMLPFVYMALPISYYLHKNSRPNYSMIRQWFWRTAFGVEDFRSSTEVYNYCKEYFEPLGKGEHVPIQPLTISRKRLIETNYHYRNALSRAVLAFLANQTPLDFSDPHAVVLDNVYLLLSQAPNLHHIYPQNFLKKVERLPDGVSPDSLMNICFLRARTNIQIGDKNPLHYFNEFESVRDFDRILDSHLIPAEFIMRESFHPEDYRDFLFARADLFLGRLKAELPDVDITVID